MAIVQTPLGELNGSYGTAYFLKSKGKKIMKARPFNKSKKISEAQRIQRKRLETISSLAHLLYPFFEKTFNYVNQYSTEFNEFIGLNYESGVLIGEYPDYGFDYSKIIVSTGDLKVAEGTKMELSDNQNIMVTWEDNSGRKVENSSDKAIALMVSENKDFIISIHSIATRRDGKMEIPIHTDWVNDKIHLYLLFTDPEKENYSVSVYLGNVIISRKKIDMSQATIIPQGYSHKARLSDKYKIKRKERGGDNKYPNEINLKWDNYSGGDYSKPTSKAITQMINDAKNTVKYLSTKGTDPNLEIKIPKDWENDTIQLNLSINI